VLHTYHIEEFTSRNYNYMTRKHDAKFSDAINYIDVIKYTKPLPATLIYIPNDINASLNLASCFLVI
jgi:hypothetical protein